MNRTVIATLALCAAALAHAQPCPDKSVMYWQAFPPGGESDLSARHQQLMLKKKCPAIETVIQYTKVRPIAVAMEARHPLMPDVPTFKELGVDWVDGAYRGIGVPKSTPPEARKRIAELWAALNADPEMKELAAKSGFELVNVGPDKMDAFMKERIKVYTAVGRQMGLTGGK